MQDNKNTVKAQYLSFKTPEGRFIYTKSAFEPYAYKANTAGKYNVTIAFPKEDKETIREILDKIKELAKLVFGENVSLKDIKIPLKDGDITKPNTPGFPGNFYLAPWSYDRPGIVDRKLQHIIKREEFYPGCYGIVDINFGSYEGGITCYLNHVQKTREGDPFDGKKGPEEVFTMIEDNDDNGYFLD